MSNKLSPSATDILNRITSVLQDAEEMGGVRDDDDYLLLMEKVATLASSRYNAAAKPRGYGERLSIHQIVA
jgi:hypothetical protein